MSNQDNAIVSVRIRQNDLPVAFEAIAAKRMKRLCGCEWDVGYTCRRCKRLGDGLWQRNIDLGWRYAQVLLKAAIREATK